MSCSIKHVQLGTNGFHGSLLTHLGLLSLKTLHLMEQYKTIIPNREQQTRVL